MRLDLNVPVKDGEIEGDKRIRESLPTIQYLLDHGADKIIIISHLGKPEGKKDDKYSLLPVVNRLAEMLSIDKKFNQPAERYDLNEKILILENLRFHKGEEENEPEFARSLSNQADLFVNDAFGTCHRAHASTAGVAENLPAFAGLLVQKEVAALDELLKAKEKPFTLILGGAKVTDKLPVVKNFMSRADNFLIGGAIANTFLAARRHYLGKSLVEPGAFREANIIWTNLMDDSHKNLYLPQDVVMSKSIEKPEDVQVVKVSELLTPKKFDEYNIVDIGPKTIEIYKKVITESKVIFWNGNMGVSEVPEFAEGTKAIAHAIIESKARVVVGGGDTVAAVESLGVNPNDMIFLSTGGGATLEYLAGKELPGLKALE